MKVLWDEKKSHAALVIILKRGSHMDPVPNYRWIGILLILDMLP
jgi:hypothetical protein